MRNFTASPNRSMHRIDREKRTIRQMIELHCRCNEHNQTLCAECADLLTYAHRKLDLCRFGSNKPACKHCPVHCYAPNRRAHIQTVMRYAGPRMLLYHPIAAIRHLACDFTHSSEPAR